MDDKTRHQQQVFGSAVILLFFGRIGLWAGIQIAYFAIDHLAIFTQLLARLLVGVPLAFLGLYVIVITTRQITLRWKIKYVVRVICGFALLSLGIGLVGNL